ncbi:MAG: histidine kinase dimerization/phosphoacceptor domain -containing protein [Sulfitobacter sp.]|jgi:two-component sensor histidine kinase|uniref:histidine kinase dimerization/phosphoacceptor domain -containing protein n=4 Tax=Sulfitobacter sp. TaxID=1903071 RepID=UPI004059DB9E
MKASLIEDEEMRLALLRGYNILDTAPHEGFDDITKLAAEICGAPIALISLVDDNRQWFKSKVGLAIEGSKIDDSMCAHAIAARNYLEIQDTAADPRTADNGFVTGPDQIRFYAGALLEDDNKLPLGTLCVLDKEPRQLNDFQRRALKVLAVQVMRQIELRKALADAEVLRKEVDHRVKNSLQSLEALIRIQVRKEKSPEARAALDSVQGRLATISQLHEALYLTDSGAAVDIAEFLRKVAHSTSEQMPAGVHIEIKLEQTNLSSRSASSVGMIVNEAMTNAAKYAYQDRERGAFIISGERRGGFYHLSCIDDGPGIPATDPSGSGLGMRILTAAAQQLGGEMTLPDREDGGEVKFIWPIFE